MAGQALPTPGDKIFSVCPGLDRGWTSPEVSKCWSPTSCLALVRILGNPSVVLSFPWIGRKAGYRELWGWALLRSSGRDGRPGGGECLIAQGAQETAGPCREATAVSGSSGGTAPALRGKKLAKFGESKQKLEYQGVGMIRIHW